MKTMNSIPCEDAIAAMQRKAVNGSINRDARMWRQALEDAKSLELTVPALIAVIKMLNDDNIRLRDNQRASAF